MVQKLLLKHMDILKLILKIKMQRLLDLDRKVIHLL